MKLKETMKILTDDELDKVSGGYEYSIPPVSPPLSPENPDEYYDIGKILSEASKHLSNSSPRVGPVT